MSYNKGLETRNKIIQTAKILFYEKGFKKTRVTEICEITGVKGGTLTYYFNTKRDIVKALYGELLIQCDDFLEEHIQQKISPFEKSVIASFLFNLAVFRNENTVHFHHEVNLEESAGEYIVPHLKSIYHSFNLELKLNMNDEDTQEILLADAGMRRELTLHFINKNGYVINEEKVLSFARKEHIFMGRLFLVDDEKMEKNVVAARTFSKDYDHSGIKLLI
ncbi:MAG: TetR/AcrR family transcriptional regulator [Eubacterium sp.]